jgi:hypothetical protein
MAISWGILVPLAIGSSLLRDTLCLPRPTKRLLLGRPQALWRPKTSHNRTGDFPTCFPTCIYAKQYTWNDETPRTQEAGDAGRGAQRRRGGGREDYRDGDYINSRRSKERLENIWQVYCSPHLGVQASYHRTQFIRLILLLFSSPNADSNFSQPAPKTRQQSIHRPPTAHDQDAATADNKMGGPAKVWTASIAPTSMQERGTATTTRAIDAIKTFVTQTQCAPSPPSTSLAVADTACIGHCITTSLP